MADAAAMRVKAAWIADEVLFPAAQAVDRSGRVPDGHLDLLAGEGFYGLAAAGPAGGVDPGDATTAPAVVEALASGCLTTTFVWMQHHRSVAAAAASPYPAITERWLDPLGRGARRSGVALTGLRGDPPPLRVRRTDDGYALDGHARWVTGWDMIDTLYVAARDADDLIHYLLVDATAGPTLGVDPLDLVAVRASRTVDVTFTAHPVPADRLVATQPYDQWAGEDATGSRLNGFLALGLANRCCRLVGSGPLDAELAACRDRLLGADVPGIPAARAAASELASRAAAVLAVTTGSRSVLRDGPAQRLVREAAFLLVFGSRPAIRDHLLADLYRT